MQFLLTGFRENFGFRVFVFEGMAADKTRSAFSVKAEIGLIRKHGIRIQELPLLCRQLLELRNEEQEVRSLTFTEEDMRRHAIRCAEEQEAAIRMRSRYRHPARRAQDSAMVSTQAVERER